MGKQWKTIADKGEIREGRHTITGTHVGRHWETKRGDKTSGRQTHHPTQALVGRQWETMGDNGRQWETIGSREDKGRQDLGKADAPSNTGRQRDKTSGRRTHHPKHARTHVGRKWETRGDKTSGRRTHRPTQADKTRPHPTRAHMWGDNRRQKGALVGRQWETRGGNRRQDVRKADAPSNTGTHVGSQWEALGHKGKTRLREGKHIIQHRHTSGETTEDKWRQGAGKADTPSKKGKKGYSGRQRETRPSAKGNKKGHNGRQGETRPPGRRTRHPTRGSKKGYNGRQGETTHSERRTHHPTRGNKEVHWETK